MSFWLGFSAAFILIYLLFYPRLLKVGKWMELENLLGLLLLGFVIHVLMDIFIPESGIFI